MANEGDDPEGATRLDPDETVGPIGKVVFRRDDIPIGAQVFVLPN